jgi:DNA invertase Pin-like site-specific DNA recombinase
MRVALYARYSDDKQSARSIEDQIVLCTRHALQRDWDIVATFSDAAISGSAMANRPGLNALLASAEAGAFDLVLVEEQDRLARKLEHDAHIFNRLKYVGVGIATLQTDRIGIMDVALKGLMNELYIDVLSDKTKRGMHSNAEKGLATGSRLYGYLSQPGGAQEIVPEEADVIRMIFALYGEGLTGREIADLLNRDHVPSPRGGLWNATSILGSRHRGNGILRSEIYVGVKVWNRFDLRKDQSGKRIQTIRPESEWRRVPVPHLAIVSQEAWDKVQARFAISGPTRSPTLANKHKPGVFSGLLKCAYCGSNYTNMGRNRLVCGAHRDKGDTACKNARSVRRDEIEDRVLVGLQTRMLSPEAVLAYVRIYHAEWEAVAATKRERRAPLLKRHAELSRTIERLVDAICDGTATPAMKSRLVALEAEKEDIGTSLTDVGEDGPVTLHPRAAEAYAEQVRRLQARLGELHDGKPSADDRRVIDAVRGLIEKIEIRPSSFAKGAPIEVELFGKLAEFMKPNETGRSACMNGLVAGGVCRTEPVSVPLTIRIAV